MAKTAGSRLSWAALAGLGTTVVAVKVGCAPIPHKEGNTWIDSVVLADVLAAVGPEVVLPALDRMAIELDALDDTLIAWDAAASGGGDADAARLAARDQWEATMMVWQELELMQVGPAGSSLTVVAGEDIRDEVYSWPTVNPCRIDQEVVAEGWTDDSWFTANLVNSYGLDALEHIVHGDEDNACPSQVDINADGTWAALGADGVEANRIAFAQVLTAHLADQVGALSEAWSPDSGDFSGALARTTADSPYESEEDALNAVFRAMFYLETVTKDRKLGQPLGEINCTTGTCPDDAEHLESGASMDAVAANLRGFRNLFTGGDGAGIDDLLVELGHNDLSDAILTKTDTAIAAADSATVSVYEGVTSKPEAVDTVFAAVKDVTDLLKGDLVTVLALEVPAEAAGDND